MRSRFSSMAETTGAPISVAPWWMGMIAGVAVFIVGLLLLTSPGATLTVLMQILAAYWLITGILAIVSLCIDRTLWGWKLAEGILGIIAGIIVIRDPLWSAFFLGSVLVIMLGIDALLMGIAQLGHAFNGRDGGSTLLGILNVIFGIILLFNPFIGAAALPFVLGIFAVIGGCVIAIRAFVSRRQEAAAHPLGTQPA